jgi:ATP-dependent DNA helicase DinG
MTNNELVPYIPNEDFSSNTEEISGIENYAPDKLEFLTIRDVTKNDIVEAIQECLKISPLIKPNKILVNTVYSVLHNLLIDNKKYVILEAPTGSGKTIIGFMTFFCLQYLYHKKELNRNAKIALDFPISQLAYFLTSAKLLQEQIDADLDRFSFRTYITMLKGVANYECLLLVKEMQKHSKNNEKPPLEFTNYSERPCKGLTKKERLQKYYCDPLCPYQLARFEASEKACSVLNYAYFLNIMRSEFNPFFGSRYLTIADEAHLIPDIISNIFNFEFNQFILNQLLKTANEIEMNTGDSPHINVIKNFCLKYFKLFQNDLVSVNQLKDYIIEFMELSKPLTKLIEAEYLANYRIALNKNLERVNEMLSNTDRFIKLVDERPTDVYFTSEIVSENKENNTKLYKHIVRDLSEAEMVRHHFLSKINNGLFMSATLGNIDEYAEMMGMSSDEYIGLRLPSTFDFEKSPIFLCKSGWLNYANFNSTIDKVIMDAFKICNEYHPNEKGIIHTSTFKITNLIKDKVKVLSPNYQRFLFYTNSDEKEQMIELMKKSPTIPYVIVGPSLYEGLDLKDDLGRFNILVKVPYAALTDYIKIKNLRFPFWYKRNTLEKIVQAIGRTNRHTNDYSSVYLLDSLFEKIIYETNDSIIGRLKQKRI